MISESQVSGKFKTMLYKRSGLKAATQNKMHMRPSASYFLTRAGN